MIWPWTWLTCARAAGRRRGLRAAARISAASDWQAGGAEAGDRRHLTRPFCAAAAERFTLERFGCIAVQKSLRAPAFSPTSLVDSPPETKARIAVPDAPAGR